MLNRREILGNGLALSALSALPAAANSVRVMPAAAIVDRDLAGSSRMAARLAGESASVHVFTGDPGRLWMSVIEPGLRARPAVLAGYTSGPTLFCLQYLSRDYGHELSALAKGPVSLERIEAIESDLLDLRDPLFRDRDSVLTWLLTPKRG